MYKKFFSLCLSIGAIVSAHSQNADYFKNYKKLGLNLEYGLGFTTNEVNPGIDFHFKNLKIPSFGLTYNIFQNKHWNFSANANYRFYSHHISVFIPSGVVDNEFPIDFGTIIESYFDDFNTRLMAERIFNINNRYSFRTGFGISTVFYRKDQSIEPGGIFIDNGETQILSEDWRTGNRNFYFGAALSAGVDIKTRDFLYRWSLNYQHSFSGAQETYDIRTFNLTDYPDTHAKKRNTGNYLSLGLTVHPSNYLFAKKPKEEKQENKNTFVRNIFKEYSPLAISVGFDYHWDSNISRLENQYSNFNIDAFSYAKNIGLHYNYFNPGRFGFRAGLYFRNFTKNFSLDLPTEATGFENDITLKPSSFHINHLGFSQMFDYYIPLNEKTTLITSFGASIEKIFSSEKIETFFPQPDNSNAVYVESATFFEEEPVVFSRISLGLEKKTNNFLYRLEMNYQLKMTYENSETYVGVKNVETQEISRNFHTFSFSNVGMSLLIRPNKNLFKRK